MARGGLSGADERRALEAVTEKPKKVSGRRYRCDICGVQYPVEDLTPEMNEEGKRTGWVCDSCG